MSIKTDEIYVNRKGGAYKLYKFPAGTVYIPNTQSELVKKYNVLCIPGTQEYERLTTNCNYLASIFALSSNEYIVQNISSGVVYKDTLENILNIFDDKGGEGLQSKINNSRKIVSSAFGKIFYDTYGNDSIVDGIDIRVKSSMCNVLNHVRLARNEFGKVVALVNNKDIYDLDRFRADFDNRRIPIEFRKIGRTNIIDLSSILKAGIAGKCDLLHEIKEYTDKMYNRSILKYFSIDKPVVDINASTIEFDPDNLAMKFKIELKNGNIYLLHHKDTVLISRLSSITDSYKCMFGLSDIESAGITGDIATTAEDVELVNEYRNGSDKLNRVIREIINGDIGVAAEDLKTYVSAIYLYNLVSKCHLKSNATLFRGNINDKVQNDCAFKSLSFCMPIALNFAKGNVKDLGYIKAGRDTSLMATSLSPIVEGQRRYEAECILNANYTLKLAKENYGGINYYNIANNEYADTIVKYSASGVNPIASIAYSIVTDLFISNYLALYNITGNTIVLKWIYSKDDRYERLKVYANGTIEIDTRDIRIDKKASFVNSTDRVREILHKIIGIRLRLGMTYRDSCNLGRNILTSVQAMTCRYGLVAIDNHANGIDEIIYNRSNGIRVKEVSTEIYIIEKFNDRERKVRFSKSSIHTRSLAESLALDVLKYAGVNRLDFVYGELDRNKYVCDISDIYKYRDKIKIVKNNNYYDIISSGNNLTIKNEYDKVVAKHTLVFGHNRLEYKECLSGLLSVVKKLK